MLQMLLWNFIVFSFLGWLGNGVRSLLVDKCFANRGFLTLPFCPMYGLSAVLCFIIMNPYSENKLLLFFGSMVVLSSIIVVSGFFINKLLGFKPWDFSYAKFNLGGYISLFTVILLGVIGFLLVGYVIPVVNTLVTLVPEVIRNGIVYSLATLIAVDYIFSIITTRKLKKKIKDLEDVSQLLGDDVPKEKVIELEENYNKLFTEGVLRRRLVASFPDVKKSAYVKHISDKIDVIKAENMREYTAVYENKDDKPFASGFCFTKLFFLFVLGCVLGTIFETIWCVLTLGCFEMRVGMVYGPFIPVYGFGACFLTIVLYKLYKLNDTLVFVISAVVGAGFEYFCSWFQEMAFGTVSWDYSDTAFNIDGRTNLMYALIWGFLGLVWVRFLYPWASKLIEKIPKKTGSVLTVALIIFMIFDIFMSCAAVYRWQQRDAGVPPSNAFEKYLDKNLDDEYMEWIFPHMQSIEDTGVTLEGKVTSQNTDNSAL